MTRTRYTRRIRSFRGCCPPSFGRCRSGISRTEALRRWLAPLPPRIHSFVYVCSEDALREFSAELDFASILLSAPIAAADDVLAAFLKTASGAHPDREAFLVNAGRRLTPLLGGQMQRLDGILRRIAP